jgi:DNA-binding transcriptional LysR family regulator
MNLQHLKYAIEIEKAGSISKAAENLFMSQPNLSKDIKMLESTIGILIFTRTKRGVTLTEEGGVFMEYARDIVSQFENMKSRFGICTPGKSCFRISGPRASYVAEAFIRFVNTLNAIPAFDISFEETDLGMVVENIMEGGYNLGIIRYRCVFEKYMLPFLRDRPLDFKEILSSESVIIMSSKNQLARKPVLSLNDLRDQVEIANNDFSMPKFGRKGSDETEENANRKHIYVRERGSQFDLLARLRDAFMWVSPMPQDVLSRNNLVQKKCIAPNIRFKDILVYRTGHTFDLIEKSFLEKLNSVIEEIQS